MSLRIECVKCGHRGVNRHACWWRRFKVWWGR